MLPATPTCLDSYGITHKHVGVTGGSNAPVRVAWPRLLFHHDDTQTLVLLETAEISLNLPCYPKFPRRA
ncbi:hypothetical protein Y032_0511g2746 [Ancylostoma ceylanicum]|uniref:Uncharacterized protein n=1 Tax=Ancylostoma ceylanicum TaxID=53326 RepID=A0A016WUK3_9BILA|nr:hypothetical protein Y032_0511g2746 [Ancylostoma ceylanicum]